MTHCIFMAIDYDAAYKACVLSGPGKFEKRFETGDPVADFKAMILAACERHEETGAPVMTSSSFEGFIWDTEEGKRYRFNEHDILVLDEAA